jgi:WD40 repeat protein
MGGLHEAQCCGPTAHPAPTNGVQASGRAQRKLAHTVRIPDYDAGEGGSGEDVGSDGDGPSTAAVGSSESDPSSASAAAAARVAIHRGHRLPATAVALAADDSFCVTVSKDGSILKWDLASMAKTRLYRPGEEAVAAASHKSKRVKGGGKGGKGKAKEEIATTGTNPDWVKRNPRAASKLGLYAVALSSDCKYLAVGGGDKKVCSCVRVPEG